MRGDEGGKEGRGGEGREGRGGEEREGGEGRVQYYKCVLTLYSGGRRSNTHVVSLVPQKVDSTDNLKRVGLPLRADQRQRRFPEL